MNSIAAYLIAHLLPGFLVSSFRIHLGPDAFGIAGRALEPLLQGSALLLAYWLILFWMYRQRLFLRI
jgi:predicted acyltransferase